MRAACPLLFVLCLSSALVSGQQTEPQSYGTAGISTFSVRSGGSSTVLVVPHAQSCPVSLQAKQSGMTDLVKVREGSNVKPEPNSETLSKPGQRIRLIVAGLPEGNKIVGATVTARGLSARGHFTAASGGSGQSDLRRTLDVTFAADGDKTISAQLVLPGFTSVKSIKLEALQFADGSTRDFSSQKLCTVAPDPMMLVAGR